MIECMCIIPSRTFASMAYQASLVEPMVRYVSPKYPWRDQTSRICHLSVSITIPLGIYGIKIRPSDQGIVVISGEWLDIAGYQDNRHTSASEWLIANLGTVTKHDTGTSTRKHVKEGKKKQRKKIITWFQDRKIMWRSTAAGKHVMEGESEKNFFTIIAEIHARSLANFYCQYADRHMNLKFMRRVSEREPAIRQFVIVKKQIDVSF